MTRLGVANFICILLLILIILDIYSVILFFEKLNKMLVVPFLVISLSIFYILRVIIPITCYFENDRGAFCYDSSTKLSIGGVLNYSDKVAEVRKNSDYFDRIYVDFKDNLSLLDYILAPFNDDWFNVRVEKNTEELSIKGSDFSIVSEDLNLYIKYNDIYYHVNESNIDKINYDETADYVLKYAKDRSHSINKMSGSYTIYDYAYLDYEEGDK